MVIKQSVYLLQSLKIGVLVDLKFQFSLDSLNKMKYEILLAVLPSSPAELAAYLSRLIEFF